MATYVDFLREKFRDAGYGEQPDKNLSQEDDYDYAAAKKAGVKPDPETGHMPDTFKKPNHITFSDESQYHGKDGNEGGHWNQLGEDRWSFTPGKTNLEHHSMKEMREYFKKYEPGNVLGEQHVDRTHHVPLLASALMDGSGGIAIDYRANIPKEYEKHLIRHESIELEHMNNLIKGGMKPREAYEEAHDKIATPFEHAAVKAEFGEEGLEKYKATMREQAAFAKEPSDRPRHPDAHTTKYGLDPRLAYKENTPEADKAWEEGGWNATWEHAVPYGGAGGNPQSRQDAIKHFPLHEFIDMEDPTIKGGGTLYFRHPPEPKSPTSKVGTANKLATDISRSLRTDAPDPWTEAEHHVGVGGPSSIGPGRAGGRTLAERLLDEQIPYEEPFSYSEYGKPVGPKGEGKEATVSLKSSSDPGAYHIMQGSKKIGSLSIHDSPYDKGNYYLSGIYGDKGPNSLGFKETRQLLRQWAAEHPDAKTITAYRVSGGRGEGPSGPARVTYEVKDGKLKLIRNEFSNIKRTTDLSNYETLSQRIEREMRESLEDADRPRSVEEWQALERRINEAFSPAEQIDINSVFDRMRSTQKKSFFEWLNNEFSGKGPKTVFGIEAALGALLPQTANTPTLEEGLEEEFKRK